MRCQHICCFMLLACVLDWLEDLMQKLMILKIHITGIVAKKISFTIRETLYLALCMAL